MGLKERGAITGIGETAVRLEALHYRTVDISTFYPYGDPRPFQERSRPC
jgi:hypothetical protein